MSAAARSADAVPDWVAERRTVVTAPVGLFQIELTNRCPMRCVMCPRTEHMSRSEGDMSVALFEGLIDDYARTNPSRAVRRPVWLHHFGESLVHPEFDHCLRYARMNGVAAGLSVNPLLLTEPISERLLDAEPARLLLSLDGHDDASFEAIRGVENAWERSRDNLLRFLERKTERRGSTEIVVSMVDFGRNRESIERTRAFWSAHPGVDQFLAKPFTTWDGSAAEISALGDAGCAPPPPLPEARRYVACEFPWDAMVVAWDGDVLACCFDYDKKLVLGNVSEQSLSEIWNGAPMQALRSEFLDNRLQNPLCRSCRNVTWG